MPYGIQSQLPSLLLLLLPTTCHPRAWPSYCQLPLLVTPSPQSHFTLDKTPTHPWRPQIPSLTSPPLPVLPVTPALPSHPRPRAGRALHGKTKSTTNGGGPAPCAGSQLLTSNQLLPLASTDPESWIPVFHIKHEISNWIVFHLNSSFCGTLA